MIVWSTWQGFSTGLPERLQLPLLRTLPGLENCSMLRPAYAVEYDYFPAYQCSRSLMTKKIDGLFFSGQINGTTGYEEAAAQVYIFKFPTFFCTVWCLYKFIYFIELFHVLSINKFFWFFLLFLLFIYLNRASFLVSMLLGIQMGSPLLFLRGKAVI